MSLRNQHSLLVEAISTIARLGDCFAKPARSDNPHVIANQRSLLVEAFSTIARLGDCFAKPARSENPHVIAKPAFFVG